LTATDEIEPEYVGLDVVEAILLCLLEEYRPVAGAGSGVVEGTAKQQRALAVDHEGSVVVRHGIGLPVKLIVRDKRRLVDSGAQSKEICEESERDTSAHDDGGVGK
jgi:hypothetical protein